MLARLGALVSPCRHAHSRRGILVFSGQGSLAKQRAERALNSGNRDAFEKSFRFSITIYFKKGRSIRTIPRRKKRRSRLRICTEIAPSDRGLSSSVYDRNIGRL